MEFRLDAGGIIYEGTLKIPPGKELCTLPMLVNSIVVILAKDFPAIHEAQDISFTARLRVRPPSTVVPALAGPLFTDATNAGKEQS